MSFSRPMEHYPDDTLYPGMAAAESRDDEPIRTNIAVVRIAARTVGTTKRWRMWRKCLRWLYLKIWRQDSENFDIAVSDASDSADRTSSDEDGPDDLVEGSASDSEPRNRGSS
jgi:hypothetical protein